jgi:hypothetical protein
MTDHVKALHSKRVRDREAVRNAIDNPPPGLAIGALIARTGVADVAQPTRYTAFEHRLKELARIGNPAVKQHRSSRR